MGAAFFDVSFRAHTEDDTYRHLYLLQGHVRSVFTWSIRRRHDYHGWLNPIQTYALQQTFVSPPLSLQATGAVPLVMWAGPCDHVEYLHYDDEDNLHLVVCGKCILARHCCPPLVAHRFFRERPSNLRVGVPFICRREVSTDAHISSFTI